MKAVHVFGKSHSPSVVALVVLLMALTMAQGLSIGLHTPTTAPASTVAPSAGVDFGKLPLSFEANAGQTDTSVKYMTHASGGTMYFTPAEVVLALQSAQPNSKRQPPGAPSPMKGSVRLASFSRPDKFTKANYSANQQQATNVVRLQFIASNPDTEISSGQAMPGKVNYYIGNDPSKWHSDVPTYASTHYENLYSGIGLTYEGVGGQLKGTYTVAAGADPSQIRWRYSGAEQVSVDGAGNLQIVVAGANTNKDAQAVTVTEQVPVAWQEIDGMRTPVSARYQVASDQSTGFVLGSYDHNYPLTIDPTLTFSTYLGGSGADSGSGIAVDTFGSAYVTGVTNSVDFPLQNPLQPSNGGGQDVFVTKFSPTGSTLIYSTYLGGSGDDFGGGIAVDASGSAYVAGQTGSTNFPLQNPFQPTYGGSDFDAFVTKLSPTGSSLIYSTYLGGNGGFEGAGGKVAVDASGSAYVAGFTDSTNFPTQNAFQPANGGANDAFVTKFSPSGTTLIYSTYLGGSDFDFGWGGVAVDASGNAYVTGETSSTDFPLLNPFQPTLNGGDDAFVTKLNATGTTLIYSTYLGGNGNLDFGNSIAIDTSGNAYVTGTTVSTNFPLQNPFQSTIGGAFDAFVTKLSPTGSTLIYSTYLGGSDFEQGYSIAVNASGSAYVSGVTNSLDFPLQNPLQPARGGGNDVFVTKFSTAGSALIYSTYLGGSGNEDGFSIAADASGAYVTGDTDSTNFPLQNPFQPANGGGSDAFVAKISDGVVGTPTVTPVQPTSTRTATPSSTPVPPTTTSTSVPPTATRSSTTTSTATNTSTVTPSTTSTRTATGTSTSTNSPTATNTSTATPSATTTSVPTVSQTTTSVANTATATRTGVANTATATQTSGANTATATSVPSATNTVGPTATPCTIRFSDVTDPTSYYYTAVYYLACRGVVSGYSDGTFRPFNNTTRGQMTKIVTLAFNIPLVTPPALENRTFTDVLPGNVFYQLIETAAAHNIVSGYGCGGVNAQTGTAEPCDSANRPYFRPSNFVTRGQLAKIVVIGGGFAVINPPVATFTDVDRQNVFYPFIETAVCHGIINGYDDHSFRPNNYAFRSQIAKIVYLAMTNPAANCATDNATR